MMVWKKWLSFLLLSAALVAVVGVFTWYTSRPAPLQAEELEPAETLESYPGTQLRLSTETGHELSLTFLNNSDTTFDHEGGDLVCVGIDALLDGGWYAVPCDDFATAGVGGITGPGESFSAGAILEPYGKLPDGEYRLSFSCWISDPDGVRPSSQQPWYVSCARFGVEDGKYVLPE